MWKRKSKPFEVHRVAKGLIRRYPTLRWLYPGMRVKRYAALAGLGTLLLAHGLARFLPPPPPEPWAWVLIPLGLLLLVGGIRSMNRSMLSALTEPEEVPERVYVRRRLEQGPKVVPSAGEPGFPGCLRA